MKNVRYLKCKYGKGVFDNEYAICFEGLNEPGLLVDSELVKKVNGYGARIKVRVSERVMCARKENALIEFNGHYYEVPRNLLIEAA